MTVREFLMAGQHIVGGRHPVLSIEITPECPLRCPGWYAYEEAHLGGAVTLRQLGDQKGDDLIQGVLNLVESYRVLQLYLVGGDPLVRHRELEVLLPELERRRVGVQPVTSAFRPIPASWKSLPRFRLIVSIGGLAPEHDLRRKPATYERVLKNIAGSCITVHCTITGQMLRRSGYLEEFLQFWTTREEVQAVRMSIFTPQRGDNSPECLSSRQRDFVIHELLRLSPLFPKLDMRERLIKAFAKPPASPAECLFAQVTETISADLKSKVTPCQFGGDPDCSRCGCMASVGLEAVATHRVGGLISVRSFFKATTTGEESSLGFVHQMDPARAPSQCHFTHEAKMQVVRPPPLQFARRLTRGTSWDTHGRDATFRCIRIETFRDAESDCATLAHHLMLGPTGT